MPIERSETNTGIYRETRVRADGQDMAAAFAEFAERHTRALRWREEAAAWATRGVQDADAPADLKRDAGEVLRRLDCYRRLREAGQHDAAENECFQLGLVWERAGVRVYEPLVKVARQVHFYAGGKWIQVTPLQRFILDYFLGKSEVDIYDFYAAVWGGTFTEEHRGKMKTALSTLGTKLSNQGVVLGFSVLEDTVTIQ